MSYLHQKFKQISRALEGVNIDSLRELEEHLASRQIPPAVKSRQAIARRVSYCERKRGFGAHGALDVEALAATALPRFKLSGQR